MERETILKVGLALVLVALVLGVGFWYLFITVPAVTPTELDAKSPYPSDSTTDSYTLDVNVSAQSLTNESDWSQWETIVRYNGSTNEKFGRLITSSPRRNLSLTEYHRYSGNATEKYTRYQSSATTEFRTRVSQIHDDLDPRTETLQVDNATQTYYHFETETGRGELGMGRVRVGVVTLPAYEQSGTTTVDGQLVTKYVPVDGWVDIDGSTDATPEAYISDTAGGVYVSNATGRIVRANVSFTSKRTEMRIGRWLGSTGTRIHIRLTVIQSGKTSTIQPKWIDEFNVSTETRQSAYQVGRQEQ